MLVSDALHCEPVGAGLLDVVAQGRADEVGVLGRHRGVRRESRARVEEQEVRREVCGLGAGGEGDALPMRHEDHKIGLPGRVPVRQRLVRAGKDAGKACS